MTKSSSMISSFQHSADMVAECGSPTANHARQPLSYTPLPAGKGSNFQHVGARLDNVEAFLQHVIRRIENDVVAISEDQWGRSHQTQQETHQRLTVVELKQHEFSQQLVAAEQKSGALEQLGANLSAEMKRTQEVVEHVHDNAKGGLQNVFQQNRDNLVALSTSLEAQIEDQQNQWLNQQAQLMGELRDMKISVGSLFEQASAAMVTLDSKMEALKAEADAVVRQIGEQLRAQASTRPDPWVGSDPWRTASAARALPTTHAMTPPAAGPGTHSEGAKFEPPSDAARPRHHNLDYKKIAGVTKLTLEAKLEEFKAWVYQARPFLAGGVDRVRQLLEWASKADQKLDYSWESTEASSSGLDVVSISGNIFDALASCLAPQLMSRIAREAGENRGFEAWRLVYREFHSKSVFVLEARRTRFLNPDRCKSEEDVRRDLSEWLSWSEEWETYRDPIPEHDKIRALIKFLPTADGRGGYGMSEQVDRSWRWERKSWAECLQWARSVVEDTHALKLCGQVGKTVPGSRTQGPTPMQIGSLEAEFSEEPQLRADIEALAEATGATAEHVSRHLGAFMKKYRTHKRKEEERPPRNTGGRAAGESSDPNASKAGAGRKPNDAHWADKECFYCHKTGHPARDCSRRAEDRKKGIFKRSLDHLDAEPTAHCEDSAAAAVEPSWCFHLQRVQTQHDPHNSGSLTGARFYPHWLISEDEEEEQEEKQLRDDDYGEHGCSLKHSSVLPVQPAIQCLERAASTEQAVLCEVRRAKDTQVEYQKVEALVDSGATDSVIPTKMLSEFGTTPGEASLGGVIYSTADGGQIPNLGERKVGFRTREGHDCSTVFQVADVKRPLLSVTALASKGNKVAFDSTGGTITHTATSRVTRFRRQGGVYILDMWVPFIRQGR